MLAIFIQILPAILSLIAKIVQIAHDRGLLAEGRALALAEQAKALNTILAKAAAAEQEAAANAAKHPADDRAFDRDFMRD